MVMDHKDLRNVTVYMRGDDLGRGMSNIMHVDEVETFVKAQVELHYSPGKNPHNGNETSEAWRITVSRLADFSSYWWTVPGLKDNGDPRGAHVSNWWFEEELWASPDLIRQRLVSEHNRFRNDRDLEPLPICLVCNGTDGDVEEAARCRCDVMVTSSGAMEMIHACLRGDPVEAPGTKFANLRDAVTKRSRINAIKYVREIGSRYGLPELKMLRVARDLVDEYISRE